MELENLIDIMLENDMRIQNALKYHKEKIGNMLTIIRDLSFLYRNEDAFDKVTRDRYYNTIVEKAKSVGLDLPKIYTQGE